MYESFYGFAEKPFSILPDPDFLYWSHTHSLAFTMLEYGILNQAGFTVVTGDIGCGKTTLVRQLLRNLNPSVTVGLVTNTLVRSGHLLEWILMSLSQPFEATSYVSLYSQFQQFLVDEYAQGRSTVLIVDEAQNLGLDVLEELRMLSNINADKIQLLQIVLIGQPQLRALLQRPELIQFAQRVSSDYHLEPLSVEESTDYIEHRLHMAGGSVSLFSRNAKALIAESSGGIPRSINILSDTALVYGFARGAKKITSRLVTQVLQDKQRHNQFYRPKAPQPLTGKDVAERNRPNDPL